MKTKAAKLLPPGLSAPARKLWTQIREGYDVRDPAGLAILTEGLRSWDRAESARRDVDKRGCTVVDKYGQVRMNPSASIERDSRAAFLAALKALKVDIPTAPEVEEE